VPSFEIYSAVGAHEANYSVTLHNAITVGSGQGQTTTSFSPTDVAVTIAVTNPCKATTVPQITFDTTPMSVSDGQTGTSKFTPPVTPVDTSTGLSLLCGALTYTVVDNADGNALSGSWAIIQASSTTGKMEVYVDSKLYPSALTADVVKTIRVTTKLADWSTNSGSTSTLQITLAVVTCDCSAMAWTTPTLQTVTVNVAATKDLPVTQSGSDPYFPPPVSSDAAKSTNANFNACWERSTPCVTTGSYQTAGVKYDTGSGSKAALPGGWLSWDNTNQKVVVNPTLPSNVGTYRIFGTYTSTSGTPTEFQVVALKIDCVVTGFTKPANPTGANNLTYKLYYPALIFDFSQDWVQAPACGHAFTDSFTWTGLTSNIITQDSSNTGRISVETTSKSATTTYTVSVQNTATVTKNSAFVGGSSAAFAPANAADKVEFIVTIENPCKTTTVNAVVMTGVGSAGSYSLSVTDGSSGTFTFVRPTTTVETETGIEQVCGVTSYTIHNTNAGGNFSYNASWAVITGPVAGVYTMTINTNNDLSLIANEASVTHNMFIKATLDDYTSDTRVVYTAVNIVIGQVTCDCASLRWAVPSSGVDITSSAIMAGTSASSKALTMPATDDSQKTVVPAFQKCYEASGSCSADGQITAITW
jgi:hypothetical protein